MKTKSDIFTIGYQQRPIDRFATILVNAGVTIVVDVRENAWSRKEGFSKSALRDVLSERGIQYQHAEFAGNPKRLRNEAESHDECLDMYESYLKENTDVVQQFDNLISTLATQGNSICLMCYERHPLDCHRSILLDYSKHGRNVQHLGSDGAKRFTQRELPQTEEHCDE